MWVTTQTSVSLGILVVIFRAESDLGVMSGVTDSLQGVGNDPNQDWEPPVKWLAISFVSVKVTWG